MVEEAQSLINDADRRYPESTFVHTVLVPTTRAAVALFKAAPAEAQRALRNATPTELGTVAGLVPFYLRGEAHLMKREYSEAIRQYESILQHRGVDPLSPVVPLISASRVRRPGRATAMRRAGPTKRCSRSGSLRTRTSAARSPPVQNTRR